jgi:hypothetical protein
MWRRARSLADGWFSRLFRECAERARPFVPKGYQLQVQASGSLSLGKWLRTSYGGRAPAPAQGLMVAAHRIARALTVRSPRIPDPGGRGPDALRPATAVCMSTRRTRAR